MPPNLLYKYGHTRHINGFFNLGKLRIGSLYDYRSVEHHGAQIGDEAEGLIRRFVGTDTLSQPAR